MQQTKAAIAKPGGPSGDLEAKIVRAGDDLLEAFSAILQSLPEGGPQALATHLGIDKVLASRVRKAFRDTDPIAVIHRAPGPDPLRRVISAAVKKGVNGEMARRATAAVDGFEELIGNEVGDRSALDAIVSAWIPEARREFELRRKQSAFRAMSQLKGAQANTNVWTVFLHPAADGTTIDVVWITGLLGLQRLRPGATIKFASRRMADEVGERQPVNLRGEPVAGMHKMQLPKYCSRPMPELNVSTAGESVHYTLGATGFGPKSSVDIVFAEANFAELSRYVEDATGERKAFVFGEVLTPSKVMQFDVFVHEDLYREQDPSLFIYDTTSEGVASVNDRARDIDRFDMLESVSHLGQGLQRCRSGDVPRYLPMLEDTCAELGWDGRAFRAYRCRIDYPLYGSQVTMAFRTVPPPATG
ncbi:MAG: hypothetical protein AAFX05_02090 [Planctomycetota bacterium]